MKIPFLFKSEVAKNFLTFVPSGILLLVVAPLEADPHHDGVILAPAIAFSENLPAHVGAFSQYGPLSPILSGMWLKLTEANLISLRYLAALQAIFLAVGLFLVLKNVIKVEFARLFTLFWIFASGIWATRFPGALMAWPSLLSTLLLIFALLLALKAVKVISTKSTLYLYTSGLLIAIAGFARAQSWAIAGAIGLTLIFTTAKSYKKLVILCFGYVCGFGVIFGYLLSSNAVEAWWLQSIYWPTQIYPDIGQGNNYNRFQMLLYLIEGALLILLIFVAGLVQNRFSGRLAALFITLFTISSLVIGYIVPTLTSIPIRYRVLFGEPLERILVSPFYLSVLASMFLTLQQIRKEKKDRDPVKFLVAIFGSIAIIQLYPQSDIMHLWWIAPLLMPSLVIMVQEAEQSRKISIGITEKIVTIFSIFGLMFALNFIFSDWKEFKNPALEGTYASSTKVEGLVVYNEIVRNAVAKKSSFDCHDGIYSVLTGEYLPADEWYVSWGFPKSITPELGDIRFICGKSLEYAENEASRIGWDLTRYVQSKTNPEASLAILKKP